MNTPTSPQPIAEQVALRGGAVSAEDSHLLAWFTEQSKKNLEMLDAAALQVVTLCTTLLGALLGVLALTDLPVYLASRLIQVGGALGVLAFLLALSCALWAFLPRKYSYQPNNLSEQRQVMAQMLNHKSRWVRAAFVIFLLGMGCLTGVILRLLWWG